MTVDETNILNDKAKSRKDGVYIFRSSFWAVKDGKFVAFIDPFGKCFQRFGFFNTQIGEIPEKYERRSKLVEWLKKQ